MIKLTKSELKKYQNVTNWEILGACALGAILGAMFAYGLMGGF
jgi:uncharacterized oligopeptide transporter (OPT) family protein